MRAPRIFAVDIGASRVACGVFTTGASGRLILQHFALESLSVDSTHESRWNSEVGRALGAIATRHRLRGTATLCLPGHLALTKFVKTPSIGKDKRDKIVAFEAAENIPYPLSEVIWDYTVVADDGLDIELMLVAAKTETVDGLCMGAAAVGIPTEAAIPAGLALRSAFRYHHPETKGCAMVANIGARSTNLLFVDGERFHLRTVPIGGNSLTHAIAEELRLDFAAAEALKIETLAGRTTLPADSPSRAAVGRAGAQFAERLGLEITRSILNYRRNAGGENPGVLHVAGGGAAIPDLPERLQARLNLETVRFDPLRRVDLAADARAAGAESAGGALADLVGVAARSLGSAEKEATLLPPAVTAALEFRRRQPILLGAAALLVFALLPPLYFLHQRASATLTEVAKYDSQLMPLRSLQARNDENLRRLGEARARIAALTPAYDGMEAWIGFFADLQQRLVKVEDVWLDRLSVQRSDAVATDGAAESAGDALPAATDGADGAAATAAAAMPDPVPPTGPVKLTLSGRLLDVANPQSRVSAESFERVKQLFTSFSGSRFVAAVENERFDNTQNGLLRFDVTLVLKPGRTL